MTDSAIFHCCVIYVFLEFSCFINYLFVIDFLAARIKAKPTLQRIDLQVAVCWEKCW